MAKNRIIFYSVFGAYQLFAFLFTASIDPENMTSLLKLLKYLTLFKYITLFGVLLILTDFIWAFVQSRKAKRETDEFRHENNTLKAKIYDIQESKKQPVTPATAK